MSSELENLIVKNKDLSALYALRYAQMMKNVTSFQKDMIFLYLLLKHGDDAEKAQACAFQKEHFKQLTSIDQVLDIFVRLTEIKRDTNPNTADLFLTAYPMTDEVRRSVLTLDFLKNEEKSEESLAFYIEKFQKTDGFTRTQPGQDPREKAAFAFVKDILIHHGERLGHFDEINGFLDGTHANTHEEEWPGYLWKATQAFLNNIPALTSKKKRTEDERIFVDFCKNYFFLQEDSNPENPEDKFIKTWMAYPVMNIAKPYLIEVDNRNNDLFQTAFGSYKYIFLDMEFKDISNIVRSLKSLHRPTLKNS